MIKCEFVGNVEKIDDDGNYGMKFVVTDKDVEGVKWPQHLQFCVSQKKKEINDLVKSMNVGAKVKVEFYVTGISGISKSGKSYQINKLMVGNLVVISPGVPAPKEEPGQEEDMPF